MSDNPYDPPEARISDDRAEAVEGSGTFDLGQCLSEAWEDCWRYFPLWLGVFLVWLGAMIVSGVTVIGILLLWPVLGWGGVVFFLNMTDRRAQLADLFSGFSSYLIVLVNMLIFGFIINLLSAIGQAVQFAGGLGESAILMGLGVIINFVWIFVVMLRFYFAVLYMVDQRMGPIEALQISWESTRGQSLKLVGLLLANAVIGIIGLLALVVGIIPATVISYLMWTSAYRQMVGRPTSGG
jgi:hypothetical protein